MDAPHTATAHYVTPQRLVFSWSGEPYPIVTSKISHPPPYTYTTAYTLIV